MRPTFAEMSIHNRLWAGSVAQHFLLSYRTSLAAVCRAQLDHRKRLHVSDLLLIMLSLAAGRGLPSLTLHSSSYSLVV